MLTKQIARSTDRRRRGASPPMRKGFVSQEVSTFLTSVRFKRLTRAQVCIDGTAAPLLGRAERSTPGSPEGRAGRRGGGDGESARRATIVSGHYAAYVFCVPDPLSPLKFRLCLFN